MKILTEDEANGNARPAGVIGQRVVELFCDLAKRRKFGPCNSGEVVVLVVVPNLKMRRMASACVRR